MPDKSLASSNGVTGIAIRAGIVCAALVCLMDPLAFGLRGTVFYSAVGAIEAPLIRILGLADYPLQGDAVVKIAVSLLGGLLWWIVSGRRGDDRELWEFLKVEVRFVLAAALLCSGFAKVLHVEMPWPGAPDWIRPLREMPPLYYVQVWTGASSLHETMLGLVELAAGFFLIFRNTMTLGALMAFGAIGNRVMIMVAFNDLRVGSYWPLAQFAAMALLLVLVDGKRIIGFFAHEDRPTVSVPAAYRWHAPWLAVAQRFAKPVFFVLVLLINIPTGALAIDASHRSSLAGAYTVETFTVNGQNLPAQQAASRWRLVGIDDCRRFAVRTVDDRQIESAIALEGAGRLVRHRECSARTAAPSGTITLAVSDPVVSGTVHPGPAGVLHYTRSADGMLELDGKFGDDTIAARLKRIPDAQFNVTRYPNAF